MTVSIDLAGAAARGNALMRDNALLQAQQQFAGGNQNALSQIAAFDPQGGARIAQTQAVDEERQTRIARGLIGAVAEQPASVRPQVWRQATALFEKATGRPIPDELREYPGDEALPTMFRALGGGQEAPEQSEFERLLGRVSPEERALAVRNKLGLTQDEPEARNPREELTAEVNFNRMMGTIDSSLTLIDESFFPATGGFNLVGAAPFPSNARRLDNLTDELKANLGFAELQAMREASPTGGALGQVTERELGFLQSAIAALDPTAGEDQFRQQLGKVVRHLTNMRSVMRNGAAMEFGSPIPPSEDEARQLQDVRPGTMIQGGRALWDGTNIVPVERIITAEGVQEPARQGIAPPAGQNGATPTGPGIAPPPEIAQQLQAVPSGTVIADDETGERFLWDGQTLTPVQ